jgi:hypothetical protein
MRRRLLRRSIFFALAWATLLAARRPSLARTEGDLFKVMLSSYLLFRMSRAKSARPNAQARRL